jgi:alkylation response protein AidB-like acyl-CoA dehydrogenase
VDFALSSEQQAIRDEVAEFAKRAWNEGARHRDENRLFDRGLWRAAAEMKLPGLMAPPEYGGRGLDSLSGAIALEGLGYACVDGGMVFALAAHLLAVVVPIWKHGTEEQRRAYLPRLCDGTWIGANAMTEPGSGSDVSSIETLAIPAGDGFRLSGTKTLITNASVADVAIVFAVTDRQKGFHGGLTAFLMDLSTPGVVRGEAHRALSVRSCKVGELQFKDVLLSPDTVLGGVGGGSGVFGTAMNWERTCLFATHVGAMARLLELAIKQARSRRQSGQPIGKFQSISNRIADMKVHLEAARLMVYQAAWRLDRSKTAALDASMAKLFASESLLQAATDVVRIYGGKGLFEDHDVERTLRDAIASTLYSGTSDIQRNIIARWLGI